MKPQHVPNAGTADRPTTPNVLALAELANMVARTTDLGYDAALHWLLHDRDGVAVSRRFLRKRKESRRMMTRSESLSSIVKQHGGVDPLALAIVQKGTSESITEAELTALVTEQAKREFPHLTEAAAFTKRYSEETARGVALRKAINVCKQAGSDGAIHPFPRV